jgi:hypothetical protein
MDLEKLSLKVHEAIFSLEDFVIIDGKKYNIKRFSRSGVSYVDYDDLRFIEQNKKKQSQWGKKAREGHKISWTLKKGVYLAQVFDGEFKMLKKSK